MQWCIAFCLDDLSTTLTAEQIRDNYAVLTKNERIYGQKVLFLQLEVIDLSAAAWTTVAVVKPTPFDRSLPELHLSLVKDHLHQFLCFFVWLTHLRNY